MHLGKSKHREKREEEEGEEGQKHLSFYTIKKTNKKIFRINFSKMSMKHKNGPEPGIQGSLIFMLLLTASHKSCGKGYLKRTDVAA